MLISQIITLLEFCLKITYFLFLDRYFEQVHGAAIGFPISPLSANLFMEEVKSKAITSSPNAPRLWLRYVDGIFVIIPQVEHSHQFLQHINSIRLPHTVYYRKSHKDGSIPFLDTFFPGLNNTLITSISRKPTHMKQYFHWDSNHILPAK